MNNPRTADNKDEGGNIPLTVHPIGFVCLRGPHTMLESAAGIRYVEYHD